MNSRWCRPFSGPQGICTCRNSNWTSCFNNTFLQHILLCNLKFYDIKNNKKEKRAKFSRFHLGLFIFCNAGVTRLVWLCLLTALDYSLSPPSISLSCSSHRWHSVNSASGRVALFIALSHFLSLFYWAEVSPQCWSGVSSSNVGWSFNSKRRNLALDQCIGATTVLCH